MGGDTQSRASADAGAKRNSMAVSLRLRKIGIGTACGLALALMLSACGEKNAFVPPPPPKIEVAQPLKQTVTRYLDATGNTAAVNSTTLVARVQGFIQAIKYNDGDLVKAGDVLFIIEQKPYQLSLEQAEAGQSSAVADTKKAEADYKRQVDLAAKNIASQATLDQATAAKDAAVAKQKQSDVDIEQAKLNLSYTEVKAPFDGIVTSREVSLGQLVGAGSPTTLATIVQLDPIYVNFAVSETDVQDIRSSMRANGLTRDDLKKVPIEVGLQSEQGYPHKGTLDYAAPSVTAATGTLMVRGVLPNQDRALLPGYFVRVRVPRAEEPNMLLVPDRVIGSDQSGRYVLVANKDDELEQRKVMLGQQVGDLRVIEKGLKPEDRVVISGLMSVVPGEKIEPVAKTIAAPPEAAP
ncbi:RND family efflux transporter MFP subunit [Hyphomicrobium denitrificans 1NES1]|uniref:RND family efflux transporter MFP subunit n=2 Tax=Hyphomicrobium denitrificans TaxID=53399 RepID=N0BE38_9HYPH|nr:RND family efflux transporter MFP subunit [Hyphomicrobium denitrificans 1NES1]